MDKEVYYQDLNPAEVTREQAMKEVARLTPEWRKYRSMLTRQTSQMQDLQDENKTLRTLVAKEGQAMQSILAFGAVNPQMALADFLDAIRRGLYL